MWPCLLGLAGLFSATAVHGQGFADATLTAFPSALAVIESSAAWGDFDNDGDLDLVVSGEEALGNPQTLFYRNAAGVFVQDVTLSTTLVNVWKSDLAWGDYNNDGFIDLVIAGLTDAGTPITNLYTNNGGASFTLNAVASSTFQNVLGASLAWADYDSDGDLDLLVAGETLTSESTKLYTNTNGIFAENVAASNLLEDVEFGDIAFGDYDNDGYVDLVFQGLSQPTQPGVDIIDPFTGLYRNDGNGGFEAPIFPFTFVQEGSLEWGDYDNDGLLDLLLTGTYALDTITKVYHNNGGGDFTDIGAPITGIQKGRASWGDYDDDGWLDILLVGEDDQGMVAKVLHNETPNMGGLGGFVEDVASSAVLTPKDLGATALWGDYNGDQKLDILTIGRIDTLGNLRAFHLYQNIDPNANLIPGTPQNLNAVQVFDKVNLSWDPPAGLSAAAANRLSYNLYIGTAPLGIDVTAPMSDLTTGTRRIVKLGNVTKGTEWQVRELPGGTYYWNVQAIDNDFEGSAWNTEGSFVFVPPVPTFEDKTSTAFPGGFSGRINGSADWGDYDNDGDLDLLVSGEIAAFNYKTTVYKNVGGAFVEDASASTPLINLTQSDATWGDYDNDGSLDILLCGQDATGTTHAKIYHNNGSGLFTIDNNASAKLDPVLGARVDWGDYNNDGYLDLVIIGSVNGNPTTHIYQNDGAGSFIKDLNAAATLADVAFGDVAWGDYDADGDLDLLLSGDTGGGPTTAIYENTNGLFVDIMAPLVDLQEGSVEWGDFNNDGFLDVLLTGEQAGGAPETKIYQNNGAGGFFDTGFDLAEVEDGMATWGDYDTDGFLDIVLVGDQSGGVRSAKLYLNQAGTAFNEDFDNMELLTKLDGRAMARWGDYNNDGLLDLFIMGESDGGKEFELYENIDTNTPSVPSAPTNLSAVQIGSEVVLSWDPPLGVPPGLQDGLTYNLYLSETPPGPVGNANPLSPMASVPVGYRKVVRKGNAQHATSWTIKNLEGGNYVWSVQAVDADYQGSPFSGQQSFAFVAPDFVEQTNSLFPGPPNGTEQGDLAWVDYDNDNDLDIWRTGETSAGFVAELYENEGGTFALDAAASASLPGVWQSASAWADYDHDGLLDVVITGESSAGSISKLYHNDGGSFSETASFTFVKQGAVAWGDYNNDGFPDLALSGESGAGPITKLYQNQQDGTFLDLGLSFTNLQASSLAWGDYNNDGFIDLLASGNDGTQAVTELYENDGMGGFTLVPTTLSGVEHGSLAWADYNKDGFEDILMTGTSEGAPIAKVYFNNVGSGIFNDIGAPLAPVANGMAIWGDYNDDGFTDVLLAGEGSGGENDRIIKLYENSGGFAFTENAINSSGFEAVGTGAQLAWGDYDKDGKLDLLLAGRVSNIPLSRGFRVYQNQEATLNVTPGTPQNLSMVQEDGDVILSWNPPPGYTGADTEELSYEVYVGSSPLGVDVAAPTSAVPGGFRRLVKAGRTAATSWRLENLPIGTYFWSVQAIDADFEGSAFAAEQSFSFIPPGAAFVDVTPAAFPIVPTGLVEAKLSWADYDGDGDLDLLAFGQNQAGISQTSLYENTVGGLVKDNLTSSSLPQISQGDAVWGDFNHDGNPDVVFAGALSGSGSVLALYLNDGSGTFTSSSLPMGGLSEAALAAADVENDGDLDLLVSGIEAGTPTTALLLNDGSGILTLSAQTFPGLSGAAMAFGDADGDAFVDLVLSGASGGTPQTFYYQNDGTGQLIQLPQAFANVQGGSVQWGDYDNDNDLDLLLAGQSMAGPVVKVYENDGGANFTEDPGAVITGVDGQAAFGDYDDDGFLDIVISGGSAPDPAMTPLTKLYHNDNGNFFGEDPLNSSILENLNQGSSLAWADYDQDGKLDLAACGQQQGSPGTPALFLFRNINLEPNTTPSAPSGLTATQQGDQVVLSWNAPPGTPANQVDGLSYNLYVGTTFGGIDVASPLSDLGSGERALVQRGPVNGTSWTLTDLSIGTYYWNVQAIDADFEGGEFAVAGGSFTFIPPGAGFIDVTNDTTFVAGLPEGRENAIMSWGDYDNDGDLDLLLAGETSPGVRSTDIYQNTGGSFQLDPIASIPLPGLSEGDADWGDYDNDGFLDLLISGASDGGALSKVYRNTGGGSFADVAAPLLPLQKSMTAWGDYDNDGDLDILLAGENPNTLAPITLIYQNNNGTFSDAGIALTNVKDGDLAWGDYNADGLLDVVLSGAAATGPVSQVFQNQGNGSFANLNAPLPPLQQSAVAWGDYTNDGYLDLALMGQDPTQPAATDAVAVVMAFNAGSGNFEPAAFVIQGMKDGDLAWGDVNDDGTLDLVMNGKTGPAQNDRATLLYKNQAGNLLERDSLNTAILSDLDSGSALAWGDYNDDGKLDLALTGRASATASSNVFKLFQNIDPNPNTVPDAPQLTGAVQNGAEVVLSWLPPAGYAPDLVNGLTYNLYVGTSSAAFDVKGPMASLTDGHRRVVRLGNVGHHTSWILSGLQAGEFFWGVQAIDADFEGSPFSEEDAFDFIPPGASFVKKTNDQFLNAPVAFHEASLDWGDYDNDGDLDILACGATLGGNRQTLVYQNNDGIFSLNAPASAVLPDVELGDVAWGDYNNDGWLDILLAGNTGAGKISALYQNTGGGTFGAMAAGLEAVDQASLAWGDYDNDGDLDILIAGQSTSGTPATRLYRNDGGATFTEVGAGLPNLYDGSLAWGDYDADGDLDILLSGETNASGPLSRVFQNENGLFTDAAATIENVSSSSLAWADFNNDGYLDILLAGDNSPSIFGFSPVAKVYYYQPLTGNFQDINALLTPVRNGYASCADYNDDGWIDIVLSGREGASVTNRGTRVYANNGGAGFAEDVINSNILADVDQGSQLVWGDYNQDGKIDLLLSGRATNTPLANSFELFENINGNANLTAQAPINLAASQEGNSLTLSWEPSPNYASALLGGLSYNLYLGTQPQGIDQVSPMAEVPAGTRRVVRMGRLKTTTFTFHDLPPGTYYWSVQAIEGDFEGSPFSAEQPLVLSAPEFVDVTPASFPTLPPGLTEAAAAWGDYNNDGLLDVVIAGETSTGTSTKLYRQETTGFVEVGASLPNVKHASLAWDDHNNDGFLDLLLAGETSTGPITRIFTNNQGGGFADALAGLPGVTQGTARWMDHNNDGRVDVLISGLVGGSPTTELYENTGPTGYVLVPSGLPALGDASVAIADLDEDGDLDVLVSGDTGGGGRLTALYANDGEGVFSELPQSLEGVSNGSTAWGDYDNDGDLDMLLSGNSASGPRTLVYQNNGGTFTELSPSLPGVQGGTASWGDYNDDGLVDIVLSGTTTGDPQDRLTALYQNVGGSFVRDSLNGPIIADASQGAALAWADYNGDGKLDLLVVGSTLASPAGEVKLYQNQEATPNYVPPAPQNLGSAQNGADIQLSWAPPQGAAPDRLGGFSYNVLLGTTPGLGDQRSPLADPDDGFRRVVQLGNASQHMSLPVQELPPGTYYWQVQTIDADFEGSPFSPSDTFTIQAPTFANVTDVDFPSSLPPGLSLGDMSWGDYDNDGDLDVVVIGQTSVLNYFTTLYENTPGGLVENGTVASALQDVRNGTVEFADADNDGDLDLLIVGESITGWTSRLYRNRGGGTLELTTSLTGVARGGARWGDMDNDGLRDLILWGRSIEDGTLITRLYKNQGDFSFQVVEQPFLPGIEDGDVAWGDVNRDGYLDLILSGAADGGGITRMFRNEGGTIFTPMIISLPDLQASSLQWADFNNDGWLDIAMAGEQGGVPQTHLFVNNADDTFTDIVAGLPGVYEGSLAWGDYDEDGFKDLVITGKTGPGADDRLCALYRNAAGAAFALDVVNSPVLTDVDLGSAADWADYNQDGKLDLMVLGRSQASPTARSFQLFRNLQTTPDQRPLSPILEQATQVDDRMRLIWEPPIGLPPQQVNALSYNLRVGTAPESSDTRAPMADLAGQRQVVWQGRVQGLQWELTGLEAGTYYWAVQSIDSDFEGSPFSEEGSFTYIPPGAAFIDNSGILPPGVAGYHDATLAWGDYDNDGDLDLLVAGSLGGGQARTDIYRNQAGQFELDVLASSVLPDVSQGSMDWGDYDNDGDLDLLLCGSEAGTSITNVYRNEGNGLFLDIGVAVEGVSNGHIQWADYNNDGRLDFILTGTAATGPLTRLFRNNGLGDFNLEFNASFVNVEGSSTAWADYDLDGDQDVLIAGTSTSGPVTQLYQNQGEGMFVQVPLGLQGAAEGHVAWGDLNADGYPDFVVSGTNATGPFTIVYQNQTNGLFLPSFQNLENVFNGMARWGDFDDDGWVDLVLSGQTADDPATRTTRVYRNEEGVLTEDVINSDILEDLGRGSALAWGDYDQDGKLDLAMAGGSATTANGVLKLYRNIDPTTNINALPPENLEVTQVGDRIIFQWTPPSGYDPAIVDGLRYNLYVGSASLQADRLSPMADLLSGEPSLVFEGNVGHATSWTMDGLGGGTYFWSVQTIEADFEGSPFAQPEAQFGFTPPDFSSNTTSSFPISPPAAVLEGDIEWGDINNDGRLDLLVTGQSELDPYYVEAFTNFGGSFFPNPALVSNVFGVVKGDVEFGDYDNDNNLDLLVTGETSIGPVCKLYRKTGDLLLDQGLDVFIPVTESSVAWGDYDNDGGQDLIVIGESADGPSTTIYRNTRDGDFEVADISLPGVRKGDVAWGDVDNDGDLDILLSGETNAGPLTSVFLNDGLGDFVQAPIELRNLQESSVAWGDYDNDGDLDILLAGTDGNQPQTIVYRNNEALGFNNIGASLIGIRNGTADWGDFDDDGDLDIILSGSIGSGGINDRTTRLYENFGGVGFVISMINSDFLPNIDGGAVIRWADYDGDNKLDFALSGRSSSLPETSQFELFGNDNQAPNLQAPPPTNLQAQQVGEEVRFQWNAPAGYDPQLIDGLSYNLYLGLAPTDVSLQSPLASVPGGARRVVRFGGIKDTAWTLRNLPIGDYFWSVQAIEADYEGSAFAEEANISFAPPSFVDVTDTSFFLNAVPDFAEVSMDWGDFNNDGKLDFVVTGEATDGDPISQVYVNGPEGFEAIWTLQPVKGGDVAWGDYDNDGDLDIVLTGLSFGVPVTEIYQNTGIPVSPFTIPPNVGEIADVGESSVDWGDYDSDGDLDLLLTGLSPSGAITRIYQNADGVFFDIRAGLPGVSQGTARWGDIDNDNDLDVVVSGNANGNRLSEIYRNEGENEFVAIGAGLVPMRESSVDWGDYNNDGLIDLAMAGDTDAGPVSLIYSNARNFFGKDTFQEYFPLLGVRDGSIQWGDYNNDGFRDVLLTGKNGPNVLDRETRIYRNISGAVFELDTVNSDFVLDVNEGSMARWGDFSGDGKLDFMLAGRAESSPDRNVFRLYRNVRGVPVNTPQPPGSLTATTELDRVVFTWSPNPAYNAAQLEGLTYNLYVEKAPEDGQELEATPMASLANGKRRVVRSGNAEHGFSWNIFGLEEGEYYVGVQTVEQNFRASEFATFGPFAFVEPTFSDESSASLPTLPFRGVDAASMDWGDFDRDGDLDLILTGESDGGPVTRLLVNENGVFQPTPAGLIDVKNGCARWGDYDGDGYLDIFLTGEALAGPLITIFRNVGGTSFTNVGGFVEGATESYADWGDFDNDGDADIVVIGEFDGITITRLYENQTGANGQPNFRDFGAPFANVKDGMVDWGDYDADGDLDLLLTGQTGSVPATPVTRIYRRDLIQLVDGSFEIAFVDVAATLGLNISRLYGGSAAWGDYDNDRLLDFVITGRNTTEARTEVYHNLGNSRFERQLFPLTHVAEGMAAWGDYNDDGLLDLSIIGQAGANDADRAARIYRNLDGQSFTQDEQASVFIRGMENGVAMAWGDYDNDLKLDLMVAGRSRNGRRGLRLYQNNDKAENVTPLPPENLNASFSFSVTGARFSWTPPAAYPDSLVDGLSYNLYVWKEDTSVYTYPPAADTTSGYRQLVHMGNVGPVTSWNIDLTEEGEGTYLWSVQSVDADFEGSDFAGARAFFYKPEGFVDITPDLFPGGVEGVNSSTIAWGDYDNDGDLDILSAGEVTEDTFLTAIYRNDYNPFTRETRFLFDSVASAPLRDVRFSSVDWGDYDRDGDLDILLCGQDTARNRVAHIYRNLPAGNGGARTFELDSLAIENLVPVWEASGGWGDYDNDGDLDLIITGNAAEGPRSLAYENLGDRQFRIDSLASGDSLVNVELGSIDMGDFNRDSYLDLVITGQNSLGSPVSEIYQNNQEGGFTRIASPLLDVRLSSVAWGDYNNDGYLDLILAGEETGGGYATKLFFYKPATGTFEGEEEANVREITNVKQGSVAWGDYDSDGDFDLLITGRDSDTTVTSKVYINDRINGRFTEDIQSSGVLEDIDLGSSIWGDFDADGKLDILLAGRSSDEPVRRTFAVYRNIDLEIPTNRPAPPENLSINTSERDRVVLSWEPSPQDTGLYAQSLSYNLMVLARDSANYHLAPMADTLNGYRRVVNFGNAGHSREFELRTLPSGEYCWSVQAVDADFQGSEFVAFDSCFTYVSPEPLIIDSLMARLFVKDSVGIESWIQVRDTSLVDRAEFWYRGIAEDGNFQQINIPLASDTFRQVFTNRMVIESETPTTEEGDEIGLEYYFRVKGRYGLDAQSPTVHMYIQYPEGLTMTEAQPWAIHDGREENDYRIISIPLDLANDSISVTIEDDLGTYDPFKWRFWHYRGGGLMTGENIEYKKGLDTLATGAGYWIINGDFDETSNRINTGDGTTVKVRKDKPYVIPLEAGWNQVGNPYGFALIWEEIWQETLDTLQYCVFEGQFDETDPLLNEFQGGFVFAPEAMAMRIPVVKNLNVNRRAPDIVPSSTAIDAESWEVDLVLSSEGYTYPLGGIGMHPRADSSFDAMDKMRPPRSARFLDMTMYHWEYELWPMFTTDIVPKSDAHIWEFEVEKNTGQEMIEIQWDQHGLGLGDKRLYLYDVEQQLYVDMRVRDSYTYRMQGDAHRFRVYYGDEAFIDQHLKPALVHLGKAYPNPFTSSVNIPFSLPPYVKQWPMEAYELELTIFNAIGQRIKTLYQGSLEVGFHELSWDGSTDQGGEAAEGVYLYRLAVKTPLGTFSQSKRLLKH